MSKTAAPRKPKTAKKSDEEIGLEMLLTRLDRIETLLHEEAPEDHSLLPGADVITRVARREYPTIGDDVARQHVHALRTGIRLTFELMEDAKGIEAVMLQSVQEALDTTEDLAIRSAYMVGLSRGITWMMDLRNEADRIKAEAAADPMLAGVEQ
jgi:hypothetical protein